MKLSFIVPVYNVEDYVCRCLGSIVDGIYGVEGCEVIVVNDGSTDSSLLQVNGLDWKGVPHTVISQSNAGLSSARNAGLDIASGDYVWFVDSDDWLEPSLLPTILETLVGQDILAFSSYRKVFPDKVVVDRMEYRSCSGREFSFGKFFHGAPFYIFRRSFLAVNNLRFTCGIYFEDSLFTPVALYQAGKVDVFDSPVYNNLQRLGSITRSSFSRKKLESYQIVIKSMNAFISETIDVADRCKWASNVGDIINSLACSACGSDDDSLISSARSFLDNKSNVAALKHSSSMFTRLWYHLGSLCGGRYYEVYEKLYKIRY